MVFNLNDFVDFYEMPNQDLIKSAENYKKYREKLIEELKDIEDHKGEALSKITYFEYANEVLLLKNSIAHFGYLIDTMSLAGLENSDALYISTTDSVQH